MADEDESPFSEDADDLPPQMRSAVDRGAQKRARQRAKREKTEQLGLYRTLLSTKVGRRDLWALMGGSGVFEVNFMSGPNGFPQPEATMFQWGKKASGLELLHSLLVVDGPGVLKVLRENDPAFVQLQEPKRRPPDDDYQEPWPVEDP